MTAQTTDNLLTRANAIRTSVAMGAVTPSTVGGLLRDMIESGALGQVYDLTAYRAANGKTVDSSTAAIREAAAAASASGGVLMFGGSGADRYDLNDQVPITGSNVTLWAPGGAKLRPAVDTIRVLVPVGDIETGWITTEGNTLASNVASGAMSIPVAAGKGANFTAGEWAMVLSDAIIPEHHSAVTNKVAEFINIYDTTGDTLNLERPLRWGYNTADNARIYRINWVENFNIVGLGIDGNDQIALPQSIQLSWCKDANIIGVHASNLQQRLLRIQGTLGTLVDGMRQVNGQSHGFHGAVSLFSYMISAGGANEGLIATNLHAERIRHPYTNGAGWTTNAAVTAPNSGVGASLSCNIGPGVHIAARGAGWDTHEVGIDQVFHNLQTLGSRGLGFQVRSVRPRVLDCYVRDCIGAAIQCGTDAMYAILRNFDWENTNLGTDEAGSTDWTVISPIQDNSGLARIGDTQTNLLDNGGFEIWDRSDTFSAAGGTANRWKLTLGTGASVTVTRRAADSALPAVGKYYLRFSRTVTGSADSRLTQLTDDVRTYSGQRLCLSWDMRDSIGGSNAQVYVRQYFGTGGSPSADVVTTATRLIEGTWGRLMAVIDVPSISGKTIGTAEDSYIEIGFNFPVAAGAILWDIDRVKLEPGKLPTTYVPEPIAVTKARCARWYENSYNDGQFPGSASAGGRTQMAEKFEAIGGGAGENTADQVVTFYTRTIQMERKGRTPTVNTYAASSGTVGKLRNITKNTNVDRDIVVGFQSFQVRVTAADVTAANIASMDNIEFHWVAGVPDFE